MKSEFAKSHKLSNKQESLLCAIQKATYEKDSGYLDMLPQEVVKTAINAQKYFDQYENGFINHGLTEDAETGQKKSAELDDFLCELVKKYWDKSGIAISQ